MIRTEVTRINQLGQRLTTTQNTHKSLILPDRETTLVDNDPHGVLRVENVSPRHLDSFTGPHIPPLGNDRANGDSKTGNPSS
jgi:hypothetical protein